MEATDEGIGIWASVALCCLSVVLAALTAEGALRAFTVFPIHSASANKVDEPKLDYTVNPELAGIDSSGFRNPTVLRTAEIVAIGDSHTFGYNVSSEDDWPTQLADMTGRTVYNFASNI